MEARRNRSGLAESEKRNRGYAEEVAERAAVGPGAIQLCTYEAYRCTHGCRRCVGTPCPPEWAPRLVSLRGREETRSPAVFARITFFVSRAASYFRAAPSGAIVLHSHLLPRVPSTFSPPRSFYPSPADASSRRGFSRGFSSVARLRVWIN